jgi:hypothetical protein
MKRFIRFLFLGSFLLIVSAAIILGYRHVSRERNFYDQAFEQLRGGNQSSPVAMIEFEEGGSASVILEHSCCSGAGFDAVAVRTSDGQEFVSNNNYCGLEGFDWGSRKSVGTFSAFLEQNGYKRR